MKENTKIIFFKNPSTKDEILFDIPPEINDIGKTGIKNLSFIPEYKLELSLH